MKSARILRKTIAFLLAFAMVITGGMFQDQVFASNSRANNSKGVLNTISCETFGTLTISSGYKTQKEGNYTCPVSVEIYLDGKLVSEGTGINGTSIYCAPSNSDNTVCSFAALNDKYYVDAVNMRWEQQYTSGECDATTSFSFKSNNKSHTIRVYLYEKQDFTVNFFDYKRDEANTESIKQFVNKFSYDSSIANGDKKYQYAPIFFTWGGNTGSQVYYENGRSYYTYKYDQTVQNTCNYGKAYQGIVKDTLGEDGLPVYADNIAGPNLFKVENTNYKTSYENVSAPFIFKNGSYLFDSKLYDYKLDTVNKKLVANSYGNTSDALRDMWPIDTPGEINGAAKYWFGMDLSVPFTINKYGTVNGKADGEAAVFNFSGDDDVWVFIDNKLVLDLGGVHDRIEGSIDFKTGNVTVQGGDESKSLNSPENYGANTNLYSKLGFSKDGQEHTMQVFYMERGAGNSNCKIEFNFPTITEDEDLKGDISFKKIDEESREGLAGNTEFTLFADAECTRAYQSVNPSSDQEELGTVTFKDLKTGVYYMQETKKPSDAYKDNNATYKIVVSGNSKETFHYEIYELTVDGPVEVDMENDDYIIENEQDEIVKDATYNKTAHVTSWDDRTYDITVSADIDTVIESEVEIDVKEPVDVILTIDTSKSMRFPGDIRVFDNYSSNMSWNDFLTHHSRSMITNYISNRNIYAIIEGDSLATVYAVVYNPNKKKYVAFDNSTLYEYDHGIATWDWNKALDIDKDSKGNTRKFTFYYSESKGQFTRLDSLKKATKDFVTSLKNSGAADESYIGLVGFNATSQVLVSSAKLDDNQYNKLIAKIDSLELASGTRQDLGLKDAYDELKNLKDTGNSKHVILITDGCPNKKNEQKKQVNEEVVTDSTTYANNMRNTYNATVYTVGLDMSTLKDNTNVKNLFNGVTNNNTANQYWAESSDLASVFSNLIKTIKQNQKVTTKLVAEVRDYIAPEFDLLDDNGNVIVLSNYIVEEGTNRLYNDGFVSGNSVRQYLFVSGGYVCYDNGEVYVSWAEEANEVAGVKATVLDNWSKTISVKAKEDFIGANNVLTNGPLSGIYKSGTVLVIDGESAYYNQPSVNVKVELPVGNAENTIFLGNAISTDESIIEPMFTSNKKTYKDVDDNRFRTIWYKDSSLTTETSLEEMGSYVPETLDDVYFYARYSYDAGAPTDDSNANTSLNGTVYCNGTKENSSFVDYYVDATNVEDNTLNYGIYTTHIIAGTLTIEKNFDEEVLSNLPYSQEEMDLIAANQTAVFTIKRYAKGASTTGKPLETINVSITNGVNDNKVVLKNLKEGQYVVEEDLDWSWKYELTNVTKAKADIIADDDVYTGKEDAKRLSGKKVYLGYDITPAEKVTYQDNTVTFENTLKTDKKWFSDTINKLNVFKNNKK